MYQVSVTQNSNTLHKFHTINIFLFSLFFILSSTRSEYKIDINDWRIETRNATDWCK